MSQETPLNKLGGGGMNQEDSQLVDSTGDEPDYDQLLANII